jgi:hypothetical protein
MKMETIRSSETSVDFHRTTRRYIPEERTVNKLYNIATRMPQESYDHEQTFALRYFLVQHINTHRTPTGCARYDQIGKVNAVSSATKINN